MKQTLLILLSSLLLMFGGKELRVLVMTPTPQAMKKIGYDTKVVSDNPKDKDKKKEKPKSEKK